MFRVGFLRSFFINILILLVFLSFSVEARSKRVRKIISDNDVSNSRIISTKPNLTLILQSLGLKDEIIGVTKFCPRPNELVSIVGDYNRVDVEQVIRLKPDLVLMSPENAQSSDYDLLQKAGVNVKLFKFGTFDEFKTSYKEIAALVGKESKGDLVLSEMDHSLNQLRSKYAQPNLPRKSFIVLVQKRPLMVASNQTFISTVLAQAGLKNAFNQSGIAYPVVDEEEFIRELADLTIELKHDGDEERAEFLNKTLVPVDIQQVLAAPQSIQNISVMLDRELSGQI